MSFYTCFILVVAALFCFVTQTKKNFEFRYRDGSISDRRYCGGFLTRESPSG